MEYKRLDPWIDLDDPDTFRTIFPRIKVTWIGSFVGMFYGVLSGGVVGELIGSISNRIGDIRNQ